MHARGLRPGGQDVVAEVETRGPRKGLLYEIARGKPIRPLTLEREFVLDRAMTTRETCKRCLRSHNYCLAKRFASA